MSLLARGHLKDNWFAAKCLCSMTRRLYHTDSYLTAMQSEVESISEDGLRVVLRETVFYPSSGGQPHDRGQMDDIPVVEVLEAGDVITHVLARPLRKEQVRGEIDWKRRYDHMQQHTGQHLLSAVFEELFNMPTLSFRMGAETSTIELGTKELTAQEIERAVLRATEIGRKNPDVIIAFEDAADAGGLRKASERQGKLRIVEIHGVDRSACGGTHVSSLGEVLPLQIRELEKVRGNQRVSFVCGNRALARGQMDFELLTKLSKTLSTSFDQLENQGAALQKRLADAEKHRFRLETEVATRAGLDLFASAEVSNDGIRRLEVTESAIDENARTKAKAFASQPKAVLLTHSATDLLVACSPDSGMNAGALVKQALMKVGGRGGGSATLAQGSLTDQAVLAELKSALGL